MPRAYGSTNHPAQEPLMQVPNRTLLTKNVIYRFEIFEDKKKKLEREIEMKREQMEREIAEL